MSESIIELFNKFHSYSKNITINQLLYIKKLLNNKEINNLLKKYSCNNLNELKSYQVNEILNKYIFINNNDIDLLFKFFSNNQVDKIMEIFKKNNIYEYDDIYDIFKNNLNENPNTNPNSEYKIILNFLSKIRQKHLNYIYSAYPKLTTLNSKYKLIIKSYDVPLICKLEYEFGYQLKKNSNNIDNSQNILNNANLDNKNNKTYEKFYYIKFYNWASFDIDNQDFQAIDNLLNKIINFSDSYIFALYKTNNGFHIHIMNKLIEYNSTEMLYLSEILDNDIWYHNYSKIIGYKIRLSKKFKNDIISQFIKYYFPKSMSKEFINPTCLKYKKIYEKLVSKFKI